MQAEAEAKAKIQADKEAAGDEVDEAEGHQEENEEREKFDEEAFFETWDEANPKIEIPPEVIDDIDNDWEYAEVQTQE